ncbi:MAG: hypothetical protein ABIJ39_02300 [Chloroflexota bacterium]
MTESKPLNWQPQPGIGYTVVRRPDGGMMLTFTDLGEATLKHWYAFSQEHLLGSDRLTRNMYDLRQVAVIPVAAIQMAVELNNDPSTRNIRLAVVVANQEARQAIMEVIALEPPTSGAAIKIFTDIDQAEEWLGRSLDQIV